MMATRGRPGGGDEVAGQKTYGHELLSIEMVEKLSQFATHWAVIIHFENDEFEGIPKHALFPSAGLVNIFDQGKLCRASMLAGFNTKRAPNKPVSPCFFRTLDFLLQYIAAGNTYRAINDKEEIKGFPPAGWLRPPVVASAEDAAAAIAAATAGASPASLERCPPTDLLRFFYSSRSWCFITSFHISASTVRVQIGVPPEQMYEMYVNGAFSDYTLMVGLTDPSPPSNLWVPPCVMMPLGSLVYTHGHGRPYLPLTLSELREIKHAGILAVGARPDARPLQLPPGISPISYDNGGGIAGMDEPEPTPPARGAAGAPAGGRQATRAGPAAAVPQAGGGGAFGSAIPGMSAPSAAGGAGRAGGNSAAGSGRTSNAGNITAAAAPPPMPPPPPEDDPILNSTNWIMPQPFDAPPPAAAADSAAATSPEPADGDAAAAVLASLPPSPFLGEFNFGVQPTFETPPLKLFLGERGQAALAANWWYVETAEEGGAVRGPYSPEQMMLSYVAGCKELHEDTAVCGTEPDIRPPMTPPAAAFLPLGSIMRQLDEGASYVLLSRTDIMSPLGQRLLANRTRKLPPPQAAAVPTAAPMAVTAAAPQPQQQQQQPQQPQQQAQAQQVQLQSFAFAPPQPQQQLLQQQQQQQPHYQQQPQQQQPQPQQQHASPMMMMAGMAGVPGMPQHMVRPAVGSVLPLMPGPGGMMRPRPVGPYVVPGVVYAQPYTPGGMAPQGGMQYGGGGTVMVQPVLAVPQGMGGQPQQQQPNYMQR